MLEKLEESEFEAMFQIMSESFPFDEIRTFDEQKALLKNKRFLPYVLKNNGEIIAIITLYDFDDFLFIEHFAIKKSFRSCGYGSKILQEINNSCDKLVCLEVEPPLDELTQRRVEFYKRNGFFFNSFTYFQPPISKGKNQIPLFLMTTNGAVEKDEFDYLQNTLYKYVYKIK